MVDKNKLTEFQKLFYDKLEKKHSFEESLYRYLNLTDEDLKRINDDNIYKLLVKLEDCKNKLKNNEEELKRLNLLEKKSLEDINRIKELKEAIELLQKEVLTLSNDLQIIEQYSLCDIREELLKRSGHYDSYKKMFEYSEIVDLNDEKTLEQFIDMIAQYQVLLKKYENAKQDLTNGKNYNIEDVKKNNKNKQKELMLMSELLDIKRIERVLSLCSNKKVIDKQFLEFFKKNYGLDTTQFEMASQSLENNRNNKLISFIKNKELQKNVYNEYQLLLDQIREIYIKAIKKVNPNAELKCFDEFKQTKEKNHKESSKGNIVYTVGRNSIGVKKELQQLKNNYDNVLDIELAIHNHLEQFGKKFRIKSPETFIKRLLSGNPLDNVAEIASSQVLISNSVKTKTKSF